MRTLAMKTSILRSCGSGEENLPLRFSKAKVLAGKLGVCPRTIFRWADEGKLRRHKINARVVLFDEAEVQAMIQASRTL